MNHDDLIAASPDPVAEATDLVRELVRVIEYLTWTDPNPQVAGRFVDISHEADVSAAVDPVLIAARAYLAGLPANEDQ